MTTLVFEITGLTITNPKNGRGVTPQVLCQDMRAWIRTAGILTHACSPDDPDRMTAVTVNAMGDPKPQSVQASIVRCLKDTPGVSYTDCHYVQQ